MKTAKLTLVFAAILLCSRAASEWRKRMRLHRLIYVSVGLFLIFIHPVINAQAATAQQLIERAIQTLAISPDAMKFKSFALTGNIVPQGTADSQAIRVLVRGLYDLRFEIAHQDGSTHLVVTRAGGKGALRDAAGRVTKITRNARAGTEVPFLPLPGMLAELLAYAGTITDLGIDTMGGRTVHHVVISRQFPQGSDPDGTMTARSTVDIFIDSENFLIVRLGHAAADLSGKRSIARTVTFADYRPVNGAMVPFLITESLDGQKTWSIAVSSIDFNRKCQDTDFQF